MKNSEIAHLRLFNQSISSERATFENPADVVGWLCAVQAQDYAGAKWALGLRMQHATDNDLDRAFAEGSILRTHVMRPTWHFVTPADIRWLLALTAPRVHVASGFMYRKLELDEVILQKSNAVLAEALQGGNQLTRDELKDVLVKAGVVVDSGLRLVYFMMYAELEGVICSGPRRGKQFTYALLDERAPHARQLEHEEALAELTGRYFSSRGPATVQDFAKWSGLTLTDARRGIEAVKSQFHEEVIEGQTYWFSPVKAPDKAKSSVAHLLSIYDEYVSSYKDRSAIGTAEDGARLSALGNDLAYIILIDGQIVGTWKRVIGKKSVVVTTNRFRPLTETEEQALAAAAQRYGDFLQLPVTLE
jgi:hypothetical protein